MFPEKKKTTPLFLIRSLQDLIQEMRPKNSPMIFHTTKIYFTNFIPALQPYGTQVYEIVRYIYVHIMLSYMLRKKNRKDKSTTCNCIKIQHS